MQTHEIVGLIAATLTTASFVPQVYRAWKHKATHAISLSMYLVFFVGILLWVYYGLSIDSLPIILANSITAVLAATIIVLKLKYR